MELGLTFPLQRFLGIKTPAWGTEPDRRFCWDLHVIRLRGRGCLLAVHCHSRYAFVRWDVPPLQREDIPGLFRAGLTDSLTAAGLSPARVRAIWKRPGPPASPALMAAGRWPSSTGRGRTCWRWTCAWTRNARPSPCWTAPSTPAPAGAQALRDWGQGWSGYPHRCYERDAGHPP